MRLPLTQNCPKYCLVKVDITSMANGLEARSPFLDQQVMGLVAQLPVRLKVRGMTLKHLLKQTFADLLPRENVQRRKMGFGVPIGELSLSRLNHGLPRAQAHPEVVQGTTDFHDPIPDALLPQAQPVFDDPTALHTAVDMLNP